MAAVENEHGYALGGPNDGPPLAPYPAYVQSDEERRRWDAAYGIAAGASALYEEDGQPDSRFTWLTTRALYNSDAPTGSEDVEETELEEAAVVEPLGPPVDRDGLAPAHERAHELLSAGDAAHELGAHDLAVEFAVEALEVLFGDPDAIPEWPDEGIREAGHAALPHVPGTYKAELHPRSRMGKWTTKLGGLAKQAHGDVVGAESGAVVHAAAALAGFGHGGGGYQREKDAPARAAHDAGRIAKAAGVSQGRANEAVAAARAGTPAPAPARAAVAKLGLRGGLPLPTGRALAAVHSALTAKNPIDSAAEHFEEKGGRHNTAVAAGAKAASAYIPDPRDTASGKIAGVAASDVQDDVDRVTEGTKKALEIGRWAHEHAGQLRMAGHIIGHAGRAVGLWAARFADDDE